MKATPAGEHVSEALRHLRSGVTLCCWLIGLSFIVQMSTWVLISTTDLRHSTLRLSDSEMPAVVVDAPGRRNNEPVVKQGTASAAHAPVQPMQGDQSSTPEQGMTAGSQPDPNVILSRFDRWFAYVHQLAFVVGACAVVVLFVQATVSIGIGAASHLAGVGRLVSCQSWSIILVALSIPWGSFVADMAYPGMFSSYADMISDTERLAATADGAPASLQTIMHFGRFLLLPAVGIGVAWIATCAFHSGAAGGITKRKRSQLDLILEEEQDPDHKPAGASSNLVSGGRASGAFKQHVGDDGPDSGGTTGVGLLKPGSFKALKEESSKPQGASLTASDRTPQRPAKQETQAEELEAAGVSGAASSPRRPI
ncbi:MAG: hypothetical protein D8M59_01590 [Planctomycetes bacterium]|nr:hypothetical protein [Planctomycetota bacterium]NOG54585.1 hypothetical protein [Planctomycetota bacterium]